LGKDGLESVLISDGQEWQINTEDDWELLETFASRRKDWMRLRPRLVFIDGTPRVIGGVSSILSPPPSVENTPAETPSVITEGTPEGEAPEEETNTEIESEETPDNQNSIDIVPRISIPIETLPPGSFPQEKRTTIGKIDGLLKSSSKDMHHLTRPTPSSEGHHTIDYIERACVALGATVATKNWFHISEVCLEALANGGWSPNVSTANHAIELMRRSVVANSNRVMLKSHAIMLHGVKARFPDVNALS